MAKDIKSMPVIVDQLKIVSVTCDLCHREAPDPSNPSGEVWSGPNYDIGKTTVQMVTRVRQHDFIPPPIEIVTFDICPSCFVEKVMPFFAAHGGRLPQVRTVEG